MTSLSRVSLMLLLLVVFTVGCPSGSTPVEDPGLSTADLIKNDLQMVVDNGQMGSEMMSIKENLEKLKETDAAKADQLLADLTELEGLSGAQLTSKAQAMIDKLEGSAPGE